MEELARELQESVRRAEEETQRSRFLNQIGTTVDLDHVLETTLEAAVALPRVDAALVRLDGASEGAARGATSRSPSPVPAVSAKTSRMRARSSGSRTAGARGRSSSRTGIRSRPRESSGPRSVSRSVDGSGGVGWLGVFSRDPQARFGDDDLRRAEELAERVAPALENARRFQEARQLADLDALTGCTTAAISTRRSRARSPARTATRAVSGS